MDALMAALVLGALTQLGDRTPWLAAILADRYRSTGTLLVAAAIALAVNNAVGTIGGVLIAKLLAPNAKLLLLALALVLAGVSVHIGGRGSDRGPDRLSGWRLGAFGTSVLGLAIMAFGDRMQFVTAALAARSALPWAAPVGATLGAMAVCAPAVLLGEAKWLALPLKPARIASGVVLSVSGVVLALSALGLIGSP